jgi:hypothetical protein
MRQFNYEKTSWCYNSCFINIWLAFCILVRVSTRTCENAASYLSIHPTISDKSEQLNGRSKIGRCGILLTFCQNTKIFLKIRRQRTLHEDIQNDPGGKNNILGGPVSVIVKIKKVHMNKWLRSSHTRCTALKLVVGHSNIYCELYQICHLNIKLK